MTNSFKQDASLFENSVKENFQFLEDDYGFKLKCTSNKAHSIVIRYESEIVYVIICYGPPDYEVSMSFGRIGIDDRSEAYSFSHGDLVLLNSCGGWVWDSSSKGRIDGFVAELSRLLQECGKSSLNGNDDVFVEMKKRRDNLVNVACMQEKINETRIKALNAWKQKDYRNVIKHYECIANDLTKTEIKKLDYAKKSCK